MLPSRHRLVPEIQGLRAVAVLAVLIYHIWPKILPGGYVGVDVFFVISGYLITGSLFKEFDGTGRIGIAGFYARRARRLLPAATLVSLAVAASIPLFPRAQWTDIANSLLASALYGQNWFLAAQAVDYLADDAKGPMNHFWSLSVEEQYYIVWPLILLPILHLTRRTRLSRKAAFGWFVGLIGLGSLAYSAWLTPLDPGEAYFATTTRAWELALGGALAVLPVGQALSQRTRVVLGLAGLGAIVAACLAYSDQTSFPGYAALLPTLGAAAVILSCGARSSWSAGWVLNSRPFQYIGDLSYSLYLWHWPLIVLYGAVTARAIGLRSGIALVLAAVALAHLSKRFVEDPFRSTRSSAPRTLMAGVGAIALLVMVGLGYMAWTSGNPDTIVARALPRGAIAMRDPSYDWSREDLTRVVPQPAMARQDVPSAYARKCHQNQGRSEVLSCDYGDPNSRLKIVMLGDSHATHWFPTFEEIARRHPIYFRGVAKSACLFSLEPIYNEALKRSYTECATWSQNVIEWLAREKPDVVLISQSPGYPLDTLEGMSAAWARLLAMKLNVQAVISTPWMPFEPSKCFMASTNWAKDCVADRSVAFKLDLTRAAAERVQVPTLDFSDHFCRPTDCPTVIGGASYTAIGIT
ncbi:acyltransferase family protein [Microvirga lotononidis]|uniref:Putative acyltransferase n=1 Tax=Microvirga lotononidis TaxID=864069 RepID=I4YNP8_9HYPH|nr:acyltransferase family protein [Microvirga lotononidis]EIM25590.1 putative acyltransferase [Microvirga lotononidis]WQO26104.1 acyltransferase family protein [Microvirga lotononidis]